MKKMNFNENKMEIVPSEKIDCSQIIESTFTFEEYKKGMEDVLNRDFSEWEDNYWDYMSEEPEYPEDDEWKYYTHSYKPWID